MPASLISANSGLARTESLLRSNSVESQEGIDVGGDRGDSEFHGTDLSGKPEHYGNEPLSSFVSMARCRARMHPLPAIRLAKAGGLTR